MRKLFTIIFGLSSALASAQSNPADTSSTLSATKKLDEVIVTSKKPFIEQQIDKTVVNVQADINAIGRQCI